MVNWLMDQLNILIISWIIEWSLGTFRMLMRPFYAFDLAGTISYFKFSPDIKMGDLLTILTIIITLSTILYSLKKERALRRKEQADKVRTAGARTIAKLDRWRELSLGMFQNFQPSFVEASKKLLQDTNPAYPEATRDFLWKKLNESMINTLNNILKENIETTYVDLYGYYPQIRPKLTKLISYLKNEEEFMFNEFLEITQADIEFFKNMKREDLGTAELGNRLRRHTRDVNGIYEGRINNLINPMADLLFKLISKSDIELTESRNLIDDIIKINPELKILSELDRSAYKGVLVKAKTDGLKKSEGQSVPAGIAFPENGNE